MPAKGRNRRTKATDNWGNPNVSFPLADAAAPTVQETETVNKAVDLPAFGSTHPVPSDFPNAYLTEQKSSPGDDTDTNVTQVFETLPGTLLTTKKTSQFGNQTVTVQENKAATALTITPATADAASNAQNAVKSQIELTTYDGGLPTAWLYSYPVDPMTNIGTRVQKRLNANGTPGGISYLGTVAITAASVANPTHLTLASPIPTMGGAIALQNNEQITITGDTNCTPSINGQWLVTIIDSTHISIPVHVTAVAGSGFGTVRVSAFIEKEIQDLNDRQCIEIWSQIDTSTLPGATKTWNGFIQYPWKEAIVGIDTFNDAGSNTTTPTGTFQIPTNITYGSSFNYNGTVAIRTKRFTGQTAVQVVRSYTWGPPPVLPAVLKINTSSGEVIAKGGSLEDRTSISVQTAGTGKENTVGISVHYQVTRIEDVITNGHTTGPLAAGGAGVASLDLYLDVSTPDVFTPNSTFVASADVNPGRLGLYEMLTTTVTVPSTWPL